METMITIPVEEYKSLLNLQFKLLYEGRITDLERKLKEQEEDAMHWWREWRNVSMAFDAYKEAHPEEGGDTDGILRESE